MEKIGDNRKQRLLFAAGLALPSGDVALAREDLLDETHVVPVRAPRADPIAYRRARVLPTAQAAFGQARRELGAKHPVVAQHGREPTVESHDAAERKLGRNLRIFFSFKRN